MATLTFSKKQLEKEIKLTSEVQEKIMMLGIPLEISGEEVIIDVTPNRPDLLSFQGFLRAVKSGLGKETGLKAYKINKPEKDYKVIVDKSVKDVRPYTACAIVKNLKFTDETIKIIIDMQEKLHSTIGRNRKKAAIGIYPLEKISLPIKFCAKKPEEIKFRPLESEVEMNGLQILQRHPTGRDYASLLEGKDKFPVFIDAKDKVLSMPPIINSHETGKITEETNSVFIECSGSDFQTLKKILNILVTTLADMGSDIYQMEVCYEKKEITPDLEPETMKINLENINKILGLNLTEKNLENLLPKMGYNYKNKSVSIPAWRTDILHEVDIAEDIAIAYGYDKIIPEIPKVATIGQESRESLLQKKIAEILSGLGYLEISSYHLIKKEDLIEKNQEALEVKDSKTEYKLLRPDLIIPALRTLAENKENEYPQKIFEIGRVFAKSNEEDRLLIAETPANFTQLKQILDYLMHMLGLEYEIVESKADGLIEGRTASITIGKKEIGYFGEVHPETLHSKGLMLPLAIIEISLKKLEELIFNQSK